MDTRATPSASERFIEQMGLVSQAEGAPRSAGRIFGLLLIEGRPLPLNAIAERLQISKASASTNARLLAGRDILRLTAQPGDRQDYYELATSSQFHFLDAIAGRLRKNAAMVTDFAGEVAAEAPEAGERVRQLADFYHRSAAFVAEWAQRNQPPS